MQKNYSGFNQMLQSPHLKVILHILLRKATCVDYLYVEGRIVKKSFFEH